MSNYVHVNSAPVVMWVLLLWCWWLHSENILYIQHSFLDRIANQLYTVLHVCSILILTE